MKIPCEINGVMQYLTPEDIIKNLSPKPQWKCEVWADDQPAMTTQRGGRNAIEALRTHALSLGITLTHFHGTAWRASGQGQGVSIRVTKI